MKEEKVKISRFWTRDFMRHRREVTTALAITKHRVSR